MSSLKLQGVVTFVVKGVGDTAGPKHIGRDSSRPEFERHLKPRSMSTSRGRQPLQQTCYLG